MKINRLRSQDVAAGGAGSPLNVVNVPGGTHHKGPLLSGRSGSGLALQEPSGF